MLRHLSPYLFLLFFSTFATAQQSPPVVPKSPPLIIGAPRQPSISVSDLRTRPIIGDLGVPLGTCVEIEAAIVAGNKLTKATPEYLLNVTQVENKVLRTPKLVEFSVLPWARVPIANDAFSLYKLKHGKETGSIDSETERELERGYVGHTFRLNVFETGMFSGIPNNLPGDAAEWQDRAFHFSTSLVVVGQPKSDAKVDAAKR